MRRNSITKITLLRLPLEHLTTVNNDSYNNLFFFYNLNFMKNDNEYFKNFIFSYEFAIFRH